MIVLRIALSVGSLSQTVTIRISTCETTRSLKKKKFENKSLLVRSLITLLLTSDDVCPGFHLQALSPERDRFLIITTGATPAYLLAASTVAEPELWS